MFDFFSKVECSGGNTFDIYQKTISEKDFLIFTSKSNFMKKTFLFFILTVLLFSCSTEKKEDLTNTPDFCSSIHCNSAVGLSKKLDSLSTIMDRKTGVYTLEDGDGSMVARAWLCENAEKSIDIQYFIFSADNVGLIAADYLVRAADRGVKVRILVDDVMVEARVTGNRLFLIFHCNLSRIYLY